MWDSDQSPSFKPVNPKIGAQRGLNGGEQPISTQGRISPPPFPPAIYRNAQRVLPTDRLYG